MDSKHIRVDKIQQIEKTKTKTKTKQKKKHPIRFFFFFFFCMFLTMAFRPVPPGYAMASHILQVHIIARLWNKLTALHFTIVENINPLYMVFIIKLRVVFYTHKFYSLFHWIIFCELSSLFMNWCSWSSILVFIIMVSFFFFFFCHCHEIKLSKTTLYDHEICDVILTLHSKF